MNRARFSLFVSGLSMVFAACLGFRLIPFGNGVLRQHGRTVGYYNTVAASYGFQSGPQSFGYVMFLMNNTAVANLHNTGGWEVGVGPSIVVLNSGTAKTMTTTTLLSDVYAFVFNQTGLMAGVGLQGSKITEIQP